MANYEINTGKHTNGEFAVSYQKNGYGAVIPTINGEEHPELMMGYVSESDMKAGMRLLAEALKATEGNIPAAMSYMYSAARTAAKGVGADEAVTIDGLEVIIDYDARKAYMEGEELANLDDMECELPKEAIKAILTERVKTWLAEACCDDDEEDEWGYASYYEDCDED